MMDANNIKEMRQALEFIKLASDDYEKYGSTKAGALDVIYEKACAALAKPPRNCDIGSSDEQAERFAEFCDDEKGDRLHCRNCRLCNAQDCALAWAQMLYEGDNDGSK